ncbi:MAG: hypothetical protein IJD92_02695 [Bacilli bacterium]|nr:hypothetical protein [Bacilli bacterium]
MDKMDNVKKRIIISMCAIVMLILTLVGITYAYFLSKIVGNTNDKSIGITAGRLELTYGDGNNTIVVKNLVPGKTIQSKTFTVENTGTSLVENYDVYLENVVNELEYYEDLTYVLECTTDNGECNGSSGVFPKGDAVIVTNSIDKEVIHNYKLTITYNETNTDQSDDMNKVVSCKVNIKDDIVNFKTFKIYGNSIQSKLPSEYQQVEYIESTGTQYIDTGVAKWENGTKFELDMKFKSSTTRCLMGYSPNVGFYFGKNASDNYELGSAFTMNLLATERRVCTFYRENDVAYLSVDGKTISRSVSPTGSEQTNFSTYLAGYSGSGVILYNIKAYKDDVLLRDMIPCYRKSDGEVGMYDLVNDVFYTNTGSGELTKGNDVPNIETPIKIESLGEFDEETGKYKISVKVNDELGNVITTYIYLNEPLRKVGNYADYIDLENRKVVRKIAKGIIDETSSFGKFGGVSNYSAFYLQNDNLISRKNHKNTNVDLLSNTFVNYACGGGNVNDSWSNSYQICGSLADTYTRIDFTLPNTITDVDAAKDWLKDNPVEYYYPLNNSYEESISIPDFSLEESNNIVVCSDNNVCASNIEVEFD